MLTVRELWKRALPQGTELLAGGAGLDRRVEWATALRSRPPAFDLIKGGEMAVITVSSIRLLDERLDLAAVMQSLADKGGVAVAILGDASADAITVADRMLLPLLQLPASHTAAEVHHTAVRFIIEQRSHLTEREQQLHNNLTELAMEGAGGRAITDFLASALQVTAAWLSEHGEVLHLSGDATIAAPLAAMVPALQRWAALRPLPAADPPVHTSPLGRGRGTAMAAPIPLRDGIGGWVAIAAVGSDDALLPSGVAHAASAMAIELARERAVLDVRHDLEGDLVAAAIQGSYRTPAALESRARRLGLDLSGSNVVMLVGATEDQLPALLQVVRKSLESHQVVGAVGVQPGSLCVLLPQAQALSDMARLASALLQDCISMGGAGLCAGVGRPEAGPDGVAASHAQAQHAMLMGRQLFGDGQAVLFSRLGVHRLLSVLADHPELEQFVAEHLGELRRQERGKAQLVPTLDAFLRAHGSPTEAAQQLGLHRNTVLYRLRRIEEIAGVDLSDPLVRLEFQLALRAGEVLAAAP